MSQLHALPKLSPKEALILELLTEYGRALYGLQLVARSKRRLKRGSVYVTLNRMEDKRFVMSHLEDLPPPTGGLPRRLYEPTELGKRVLAAWTAVAELLMPEVAR